MRSTSTRCAECLNVRTFVLPRGDGKDAALAKVLGPAFSRDQVADTVANLLSVYTDNRIEGESFLETYRRIGLDPFKERVYAQAS